MNGEEEHNLPSLHPQPLPLHEPRRRTRTQSYLHPQSLLVSLFLTPLLACCFLFHSSMKPPLIKNLSLCSLSLLPSSSSSSSGPIALCSPPTCPNCPSSAASTSSITSSPAPFLASLAACLRPSHHPPRSTSPSTTSPLPFPPPTPNSAGYAPSSSTTIPSSDNTSQLPSKGNLHSQNISLQRQNDLFNRLLDPDPTKRPAAGPDDGYATMKAHPFFHGI